MVKSYGLEHEWLALHIDWRCLMGLRHSCHLTKALSRRAGRTYADLGDWSSPEMPWKGLYS